MLFDPRQRTRTDRNAKLYANLEVAYTGVDFAAALSFVVGSVLFFFSATQTAGTWCFLVGSVCFALKPTIRLVRELRYRRMDDYEDLAERYESS